MFFFCPAGISPRGEIPRRHPRIQTKKLSILPTFYFHDALEQLKTNFHTNFRFKRVFGFVIEYA